MRLFVKVTLVITLLLSVVLSVCGYMMIERNFNDSLEFAKQRTAEQQRREVYQMRGLLFSSEAFRTNPDSPFNYIQTAAKMQESGAQIAVFSDGMQKIISNLPEVIAQEDQRALLEENVEGYVLREYAGQKMMLFVTSLDIPNRDIRMLSVYDISDVFLSREEQVRNLMQISLVAIGCGFLVALVFSLLMTAPINKLKTASRRIAAGDYQKRTGIKALDETGDLSRNFDNMADAIEEKVASLNDGIKRQQEFVAAFTHEMKTPMTSIVGYSALLRSKERDEEASREYLDYIHSESKRLESLSQKLLRLMGLREEKIELSAVKVREIFEAVKKIFSSDERAKNIFFEECDTAVMADAELVEDLLGNLILNALDAIGANGAVTVGSRAKDSRVVIFVKDDGIGIPKSEIPHITEAFYMVDKSRAHSNGGSGIGLSLAERIAALHGSDLRFESEEGAGTTVSFSLAMAKGENE